VNAFSIAWSPLLSWSVIGGLALAALLIVGFAAFRRAPGIWWRALAALVLLATLANPSLVEEERDPLKDVVVVVVDESPSQRIGPRETQTTAAVTHLMDRLGTLENTDVRVVRAGTEIGEDGTRLFQALQRTLANISQQQVGAIIMVSDGQVHDAPESLQALGLAAPLHLLLSGQESEGDRRLTIGQAPSFGIVGKTLSLKLTIEDLVEGTPAATAKIVLLQDGEVSEILELPVGVEQEIEFELDRRGPSVLEVEVDAGPEELTLANNHTSLEVNGVRERLRVLLVSGEPHAGERAWRNILKSDPSVDLVHFTILRPPEKQDGTPIRELSLIAFPTRELFEVKLEEFDLIIFDRYRRRGVLPSLYLDNIARYIAEGGALFEAVGPTFATPLSLYRTPLGRVLPGEPSGTIFEQGYRPRITDLGERHPVTAGLSPPGDTEPRWGRWFRQIDATSTSGNVVMSGVEDRPLLILDRTGEGRVAQLLSDHMWLWSRGFEGGGPHAELLRRIAHWLMKEPDLEEEDLRAAVSAGRLEVSRRSLSAELPTVEVTFPSGEKHRVELTQGGAGRANASLPVAENGLYKVTDGSRTALAAAGPSNPREFEDLRSSAGLLKPLIDENGGVVRRLANKELPKLRKIRPGRDLGGQDWIGVRANGGYVVTGVSRVPLMPGLLILFLALGFAVAAWHREGQ
jgi:hypothetical protein